MREMENKTRVVIADDHPIFRRGLKQVIESDPAFIVIFDAADGETALNKAIEEKPDVIVLDLNMPKMTGMQVAEALPKKSVSRRNRFPDDAQRRSDV